jgi:hypothetical protein
MRREVHSVSAVTLHMVAAMDKPSLKLISEEDFQKAVCGFAAASGYLVHYQRRSGFIGKDGTWKGSGPAGFPDIVLVKANRNPIFCELKTERGRLRPDQVEWMETLGAYHRVWRPRDAHEIINELGHR